jgi:hypothetical protein
MSSAWQPESDGSTEVVNREVETTILAHINYMQTNWSELLCMVEFAINNSKHSSTRFTPFFMNFGRHPLTPLAQSILPLKILGHGYAGFGILSQRMEDVRGHCYS